MTYRPPPTEAECHEAFLVMLEAYGYRHTVAMLEKAQDQLKAESAERRD